MGGLWRSCHRPPSPAQPRSCCLLHKQELRQAGFSQRELDERRAATQKQLESLRAAAAEGLDK